ncbi:hypothetical protein PHMEG_00016898 [Phytophthora megakarya]|uniref:PX domain-containing protein n=1 Tax=Phytophthora megakarya TaxID=4795 RepID=A0A225VYQ8_9STRA|nr:hypothetical protein PHMEG_00016898 [Phytophthora megakarya]
MGCSQSKASTDQVVERVSVDSPAVEVPAPESADVPASEPVVEAPPASEDLPPAPASIPVQAVEEVEEVEEPVEEAPKSEESDPVEEAPTSEAAPAEEVVADAAIEDAPKTEEKITESEPEEDTVEAEAEVEAPKSEPAAEVPVEGSPVALVEDAPVEAPVQEEALAPAEEPKVDVTALVSEVKPEVQAALTFKAVDVTFNDKGVAFFNFDGSDANNPVNDVHLSKRYSEFKALHTQLMQQLADNHDDKKADIPALPKASILQGRKNKKMLDDRKAQFTALLNVIAADPVASQSDAFKAFLA